MMLIAIIHHQDLHGEAFMEHMMLVHPDYHGKDCIPDTQAQDLIIHHQDFHGEGYTEAIDIALIDHR